MARILWITGSLALVIAVFFGGFQLGKLRTSVLCVPDEACVREWLAATSGRAAVMSRYHLPGRARLLARRDGSVVANESLALTTREAIFPAAAG